MKGRSLEDPSGVLMVGADPPERRRAVRGSESPLVDAAARNVAAPPGGSFDNPFLMGTISVWFDTGNKMRFKTTPPANDTDGTVVGTQV